MKKTGWFLLWFGSMLLSGCSGQNVTTTACDEATSHLVAQAYVLSIPVMERERDLAPLMESHPKDFAEGGKAIRCMQALGSALVQSGLTQSSRPNSYSATERFAGQMPPELAHLPGQVDQSLRGYASNTYGMGQELLWLSRVLPQAAQGNYGPYNNPGTESRRAVLEIQPIYRMLCQMEPGMCQTMRSMFLEMAPVLEQQIFTLARQFGG